VEVEPKVKTIKERKQSNVMKRRGSQIGGPSQSTLQMYEQEDKNFKKGVDTTKNILKDVKLMNMKLDDITDLVRLQRQKLLSLHNKIEQSQNYMNRSKKIIQGFSKELYGDCIIKTLIILISFVMFVIGVAAVKYKMKSEILIGKNNSDVIADIDYGVIDETMFWKENRADEGMEVFKSKENFALELLKQYVIRKKLEKGAKAKLDAEKAEAEVKEEVVTTDGDAAQDIELSGLDAQEKLRLV